MGPGLGAGDLNLGPPASRPSQVVAFGLGQILVLGKRLWPLELRNTLEGLGAMSPGRAPGSSPVKLDERSSSSSRPSTPSRPRHPARRILRMCTRGRDRPRLLGGV